MKDIIIEMIAQAEDERNLDLISSIRDLIDKLSGTFNCPSNWRDIGGELATEYPEDSWVYENLGLDDYAEQQLDMGKKLGCGIDSHSLFFVLLYALQRVIWLIFAFIWRYAGIMASYA